MKPGPTTHSITVEEFDRMDLPEDRDWELQDGEVVEVTFPALIHRLLQERIQGLLKPLFAGSSVLVEFPFQIGEHDKRSADIGVVANHRMQPAIVRGILLGAPDIVVEVFSPSNSWPKMKQYRRLCLNNGAALFLVADPADNTVEASTAPKDHATYSPGQDIPLDVLGVSARLSVTAIFEGITLPAAD